jgi:hypothetical protein
MKSQPPVNSRSPLQFDTVAMGEAAYLEIAESCRHFYALTPPTPNTSSQSSSSSSDGDYDLAPLLEDALRHQKTTHHEQHRVSDTPKVRFRLLFASLVLLCMLVCPVPSDSLVIFFFARLFNLVAPNLPCRATTGNDFVVALVESD